jgi:hypothetical protein
VAGRDSALLGAARGLPGERVPKLGNRDPADGRPVKVAVDHLLDVGEAEVWPLAAYLYQQFLHAVVVPFERSVGSAGRSHFRHQVVHHVAHVLIMRDLRSRLQVMRWPMLARVACNHGWLA